MRRKVPNKFITISFNDLLTNSVDYENLRSYLTDEYSIFIDDDREFANRGDIDRAIAVLNDKFPDRQSVTFQWLKVTTFNRLCAHVLDGEIENVNVLNPVDKYGRLANDLRNNNIVPVTFRIDSAKDLWRVSVEHLEDIAEDMKYDTFSREVMSDKDVEMGINYICTQIEQYAQDDLEKVILLDKMLRENIHFDNYVYSTEYNRLDEVSKRYYKGRTIQSLLTTKKCVCAGISLFSALILNKLNVPTRVVNGHWKEEGHAWNEVIIDGKNYSCDFTHNMCFDRNKGTKYLLVQKPSPEHTLLEGSFDELSTYDRNILLKKQEKLKNISIKMPSYNTRRRIEQITSNEINKPLIRRRKIVND